MLNKYTTYNLFQDVVVDGETMFEQQSIKNHLKFKFMKENLKKECQQLIFVKKFGCHPYLFILTVLKHIAIAKKLFVLELEQGNHVFIPNMLS